MRSPAQILSQKDIVTILAYSPTGLGHLRVTKALYEGLPNTVAPLLLGSHDKMISSVHRFASIHLLTRVLLEYTQRGALEDVFTGAYRLALRPGVEGIYQQIETILEQKIHVPKVIVLASTHSSLAHQFSMIKSRLETEKQVRVVLIVQVTDDTPQHLWYIPHADVIVVPSERTKELLTRYGKVAGLPEVDFHVHSYPISPRLTATIPVSRLQNRRNQVQPNETTPIEVAIPVSGAAVGTDFMQKIMLNLHTQDARFRFFVVSKIAPYTEIFLHTLLQHPFVKLYTSAQDREVVDLYEYVYQKHTISLEITKPSEQAFKALCRPNQVGGSILLFSEPVGQQEYDNLYFLRRHNLIPLESEQEQMFEYARNETKLGESESGKHLFQEAQHWRGLRLPQTPEEMGKFIIWCLNNRIFAQMLRWRVTPRNTAHHAHELGTDGVQNFWELVGQVVEKVQKIPR